MIDKSLHIKSFKNLGKHFNCSKCRIALTTGIYKKDRKNSKKRF